MTAKEIALWLLDDLCIIHTGFDKLALRELINKLDDRFIKIDMENKEATIQIPSSNSYYLLNSKTLTKVDQYFGTGRTNLLVSSLERFLHTYDDNTKIREAIFDKFQERIDAIYIGISEFKNIESLEDEFVELKQDILNLESEINQTNIIKILQNAGFLICNGTKESIMKAIDNYLANNEKTINNLD